MERLLSLYGRGGVLMAKFLAGVTLVFAVIFLVMGEGLLIGGLFTGYLAGAIFCWTLTNRMSKGEFDEAKAASQMQSGLFIRFGSLCVIMALAAQVSRGFFFVSLLSYLVFLVAAFVCFVLARVRKE